MLTGGLCAPLRVSTLARLLFLLIGMGAGVLCTRHLVAVVLLHKVVHPCMYRQWGLIAGARHMLVPCRPGMCLEDRLSTIDLGYHTMLDSPVDIYPFRSLLGAQQQLLGTP